jgi:thiol-disulfide isomerase/thioredoxin
MKTKNAKPQTVVKESDSPPKDTASSWPKPRWEEWLQSPRIRLYQAVALSCDLRPAKILLARKNPLKHKIAPERCREYRRRLRVALRNLGDGLQPVEVEAPKSRCWIKLAEFRAWAVGMEWTLPDQFRSTTDDQPIGWPWGKHNTELLTRLKEAAIKFWAPWDPQQPKKAPTEEDVAKFLREKGVAKGVSQVMAQILRPTKGIKSGPRGNG